MFEHALFASPRVEHGYCTDDVARALTVVAREQSGSAELARLTDTYLAFVERAVVADGSAHNRMSAAGEWMDAPTTGDWWGRAVGGLGQTVSYMADSRVSATADGARGTSGGHSFHDRALTAFHRAALARSTDVRSSSFAAIGAACVLRAHPDDLVARALLGESLALIPRVPVAGWMWIEPRLRYANGSLCDALIVGGAALDQPDTVDEGLAALAALLDIETNADGVLSITGPQGRGPADHGPLWDQQPLEPAAIADACLHATAVSTDPAWAHGVALAWGWFMGDNDAHTPMYEPGIGAGYDGLEPGGRNENCGAESTLAAIGTAQHRRALALVTV